MTIKLSDYTAHQYPGKFEGENPATEYFYGLMLDGDGETIYPAEDSDFRADIFTVDADEAEAFGLPIGSVYMIREDSQGFAIGSSHPTREDAEKRFADWCA